MALRQSQRNDRLAAALRENLKRRKARARVRSTPDATGDEREAPEQGKVPALTTPGQNPARKSD
jgi:hypothetical protein